MPLSTSQKNIGYAAGVLGALQAIVYFTFSLLCVIYYYKDVQVDPDPNSFLTAVYWRLIYPNGFNSYSDIVIQPSGFIAFNWIYVFLNFCWFIISLNQVYDIAAGAQKLYKSILSFSFCTFTISVCDFIFVFCLGVDYGKNCGGEINPVVENLCQNAVLPVLFIVAKGFVFWFVNVTFAYMLRQIARNLKIEALNAALNEGRSAEIIFQEITTTGISSNVEASDFKAVSPPRLPRYEYRWQWAYRPGNELRYNSASGTNELVSTMVYSYGYDYVLVND